MDCKLQPFKISIYYKGKKYNADVTQTSCSITKEVFDIVINKKLVQVQSNRPFIKSIPNSKKKPDYKGVNAKVEQQEFFEIVISAIQTHIRGIERPPYDWSEHPKNAGLKKPE